MLLPSSMIFLLFPLRSLLWFYFSAHSPSAKSIASWRRVFVCYACAHMVSSRLMLHVFTQKSTTHWVFCKFLLELFLIDTHFTFNLRAEYANNTPMRHFCCFIWFVCFRSISLWSILLRTIYINVITLLPVCRFAFRALRRAEEKAVGTRSRFISLHLCLMPLYMGAVVFPCCCSFVTRTEASMKCHGYSIPLPVDLNKPMEGVSPKTTYKRTLNI